MVTIKIDNVGNISSSTPKTMKVRILRPVSLGAGVAAIEGDVWEVCRADAVDLIAVESAERVTQQGEIEIRSSGLEVIAKSEDDPPPRLISRIPERDRKPRNRIEFPPNLLLGHVLASH